MNRHVLLLAASKTQEGHPTPDWRQALIDHNFELLCVETIDQAVLYAKSYPLVGVLIEAGDRESEMPDWIERIAAARTEPSPVILGIFAAQPRSEALDRMAKAGLAGVIFEGIPPAYLLTHIIRQQALQGLQHLEQTGIDVRELSEQARFKLHELCQPFGALQGRLQILASKTPESDPLYDRFQSLANLSLEVSARIRELQELSRKYS